MTVIHLQSGNSSKCLSRYVLADCERDKSGSQIMRYNNIFVVIYFCQFCSPIRCSTVLLAYTAQHEWNWIKNSNHHHHHHHHHHDHDHNSNFFFFNNLEKSIKKTMQLPVTWHQLPLLYNQSSWLMDKSGKCGDPYPLEKQMYQVYFSQS